MRFLVRTLVASIVGVLRLRPSAELVAVPAIVLLLMVVAGPSLLQRREQARQQQRQTQLRQIGQSLSSYHDTFQRFPASPSASRPAARRPPPAELISPL